MAEDRNEMKPEGGGFQQKWRPPFGVAEDRNTTERDLHRVEQAWQRPFRVAERIPVDLRIALESAPGAHGITAVRARAVNLGNRAWRQAAH